MRPLESTLHLEARDEVLPAEGSRVLTDDAAKAAILAVPLAETTV